MKLIVFVLKVQVTSKEDLTPCLSKRSDELLDVEEIEYLAEFCQKQKSKCTEGVFLKKLRKMLIAKGYNIS